MKVAMDHDLVPFRFQILEPSDKGAIFRETAAMMVIGNDQERANLHAVMRQLPDDFLHARSSRRCDIMHGNHQRLALRFRGKLEDRRERCRSGAGHAGFSISIRRQTSVIALAETSHSRRPYLAIRTIF